MHRLFVAIDLAHEIRQQLMAIPRTIQGARWVPPDQMHLTLRFIGDTDDLMLSRLQETLARVACPPFSLALEGIGHFPPRGMPRVLWVGVENKLELTTLQSAVESACSAAGIAPEVRKFSPHLTIARLKETPLDSVRQFEAGHAGFRCEPFQTHSFHLYESSLSQHGAIHRQIARYPLKSA